MGKEDLIEKCTEIFTSYGVKVSMDEISRMQGVSKRTLYEFFDSKENLICECINFIIVRMQILVDAHFSHNTNVIEKLFPMSNPNLQKMLASDNRFMMDVKRLYTDIFRQTFEKHIESYKNRIISIIKEGMNEGVFLSDINPYIIVDVIFTIHRLLINKQEFLEKYPPIDLFKNTVLCYLRGISTPKGLKLGEQTFQFKDFDSTKIEKDGIYS
jgi:AcrR family transcriptional regulator